MNPKQTILKYGTFFVICLSICIGMFASEKYWMPRKYTQEMFFSDPMMKNGIMENFLVLTKQMKSGELPLVENVAYPLLTPAYKGAIVKMSGQSESIPYVKYRLEVSLMYPYSPIPRVRKLDAIIVNINPGQNPEFADLFWNIK